MVSQRVDRCRKRRGHGDGVTTEAASGLTTHPPDRAAGNREISNCAAAAKGESAWACSKVMLQAFRQP